ncbi:MAG TPA: 4-alpha-glucanotransferase [Bryobacteraceae bacterium]|nr:4-alpha-glucanotransferase [Bryobacteraceae bacterium]
MNTARTSGILLHPTSLPGPFGIGELGPEALRFVDWLAEARQQVWQMLPLGPTAYGDSPYQLFSAFAGNPLLISVDGLQREGWLQASDLDAVPQFAEDCVEFESVIGWKAGILRHAFARFHQSANAGFDDFCRQNAAWLEDYALFMSLKKAHGGEAVWTRWNPAIARREPAALETWKSRLMTEIEFHKFTQFAFFRQWRALQSYCAARGIRLMGDVPIYVAHDSADVWAHPDLFQLDEGGEPVVVAGVPPDYFSATGQLWGNPIYRWDRIAAAGYEWWIERMRAALASFDFVRMDHFRGFEAYWEVPAGEKTAIHGRWIKGPGADLFRTLQAALGRLLLVAENLGVITPEVEAIRTQFGFPGMAILQFAFGKDAQAPGFKPHNYSHHLVAYTGTHDNDPVMGWWRSAGGDSTRTAQDVEEEKAYARAYLNTDGCEMNWVMIRTLMASVADTILFPAQDVLGLGSESRMNTPGIPGGNWRWRYRPGAFTAEHAAKLRRMAELYDRAAAVVK